ncbi:MAG: hypothetical protein K940chlam7_01417, partial [Chlamydiae bacterium]|nr:hypothetical protein [Chlamydiota bacterium]
PDIEIQGSDPLQLIRYYDGGHHFSSEFGYGMGMSLPKQLTFGTYLVDEENMLSQRKFHVEQRMGLQLPFLAKELISKKIGVRQKSGSCV